MQEVNKRSGI